MNDIEKFFADNPYKDGNCVVVTGAGLLKFLEGKCKDFVPDNLDYSLGADREFLLGWIPSFIPREDFKGTPIVFDYDFRFCVSFGACEGVYIDLWFERIYKGKREVVDVATIKTLDASNESFRAMTRYGAELYLAYENLS